MDRKKSNASELTAEKGKSNSKSPIAANSSSVALRDGPGAEDATIANSTASTKPPLFSKAQSGHMKQVSEGGGHPRSISSANFQHVDQSAMEDILKNYKLMEAMRSNDVTALMILLQPLASSPSSSPKMPIHSLNAASGTPLHMAAAFASRAIMELLLKPQYKFSLNAQDLHGNTALHIASRAGRFHIVAMLLKAGADDTIVNDEGRDSRDVAKTRDIGELIDESRKAFTALKTADMHKMALAGNLAALQEFFSEHRTSKLVDINSPEPVTGDVVLHLAAEQNNLDMVTWCLKMKADPLIRDKRGKLSMERTKNDKIKNLLKEVLSQSSFSSSPTSSAIKIQGMLYKWTNYASGYKKRWFVLEDGVLSYYHSQEDVPVSCRGSISLKVAKLWIDSSDRNRFDVIGKGNIRFHLRAEHPVEAKRWVIALTEAKQWLQDNAEFEKSKRSQLDSISTTQPSSGSQHPPLSKSMSGSSFHRSRVANDMPESEMDAISEVSGDPFARSGTAMSSTGDALEDEETTEDSSFNESFHAMVNSALACAQYEEQLMAAIAKLLDSKQIDLIETFRKSSATLKSTLHELITMSEDREQYWRKRFDKEEQLKRMWDENLRELAAEHDALQIEAAEQVTLLELQAKKANSSTASLEAKAAQVITEEDDDEFFDALEEYEHNHPRKSIDLGQAPDLTETKSVINASTLGYPPGGAIEQRKLLPLAIGPTPVKVEISLWSVLRNNIGKDLSKIALPVFFNEPLSMLQRFCEDMEYSTLLDIAASQTSSLNRTLFVAAFAMSNYSSTLGRTGKPFNPLLGETYEYVRKDRGFRYLAEQVSHHPPISACYCESDHYIFWAEANLKNKFWGKSLEIMPLGVCHVVIKATGEHFSWRKVTTCVNNLIVGKLWIDHYGDMIITNHKTSEKALVRFKPAGWRGKGQYEIEGDVTDSTGRKCIDIFGTWNDRLMARPALDSNGRPVIPTLPSNMGSSDQVLNATSNVSSSSSGTVLLWKRHPLAEDSEKMFNFTEYAASLNEISDSLREHLCPSDTRLRPDQRAMEEGQFDVADQEKIRLEEKQRTVRRLRNEEGKEWAPTWFYRDLDADSGEEHWVYKGGYWEARATRNWPKTVPALY